MAVANILGTLRTFFGYSSAAAFARDWKELTDEDKNQLKAGLENGTLTY